MHALSVPSGHGLSTPTNNKRQQRKIVKLRNPFPCFRLEKRVYGTQAAAETGSGIPLSEEEEAEEPVQLALVGRPNVGESGHAGGSTSSLYPSLLMFISGSGRTWCARPCSRPAATSMGSLAMYACRNEFNVNNLHGFWRRFAGPFKRLSYQPCLVWYFFFAVPQGRVDSMLDCASLSLRVRGRDAGVGRNDSTTARLEKLGLSLERETEREKKVAKTARTGSVRTRFCGSDVSGVVFVLGKKKGQLPFALVGVRIFPTDATVLSGFYS